MAQQKSAQIISIAGRFDRPAQVSRSQPSKSDPVRVSLQRQDLDALLGAWSIAKKRIDGLWDFSKNGVVAFEDGSIGFQMLSQNLIYQTHDLTIEKMEQGPKMFYNIRGVTGRNVRCETIKEVVDLVKNVAATAQQKKPSKTGRPQLVPKG